MIRLVAPQSFWNEDTWETYRVLFQFTPKDTSGKIIDISWYTKYLSDGETDVDLDELVRENERIEERLLTRGKVRKIRRKRKSSNQTRESLSSSKKKRENHVLVHSVDSNTVNHFQRVRSRSTESAPKSSKTLKGFKVRPLGDLCEEEPPKLVKYPLRPISLRHVNVSGAISKSSGTVRHSDFEEDSAVRYTRDHFREDADQEWHRHDSTETEDEPLKSPVVSDLVSKFESVRRRKAFSYGKTKTYDPLSRAEKKASRNKEEVQHRTIRIISRNSLPLDQTDSRITGSSNQSPTGLPELYKTPQRTSDASTTTVSLLRMKSESHSRVYPANLSGLNTPDQFLRSSSESNRLRKGYSVDSGAQTQKPFHHPMTFTNGQRSSGASKATEFPGASQNHASVISKMPLINVDGANMERSSGASRATESYHSNSSRSDFDKSPDTTSKITCNIAKDFDEPLWKTEVELRRKTKSYVSAHKPEQPIQLGIIPEWKKQLLEKNKMKRNSTENQHDPFNTRLTKQESSINFTEPPWKLEFDKIKRQVAHHNNHHDSHAFERETPEWVKLAEQRRRARPITENDDDHY